MRIASVIGASALSIAAATTANAQNSVTSTVSSNQTTDTAQDNGQLSDIIVTANRRAERAQDVPISIAVVKGDTLAQTGARGLEDLRQVVPSVQFDPTNGGGFNIRGIGTQVYDLTAERAVSIVIDDVVQDLPRDLGINGLVDINRIEVLRGPQGIQFGKNSSAGVVSVVTERPTFDRSSGAFLVEYGERNDRKVTVNANVPLGDTVAVRVSGYNQGEEGLGRYTVLDRKLGTYKSYGVRAKLLWQPSDSVNFLLIADANHYDDNGLSTGAALVSSSSPAALALARANGITVGPDNRDSASDVEGKFNSDGRGISLTANWNLGDNVALTSVSAYREVHLTGNSPVDPDPVTRVLPFNVPDFNSNKLSEELRVSSRHEGLVNYVFGLFYNRLRTNGTQEQSGTLGQPLPPNTFISVTNGLNGVSTQNESKAAFGTLTIKPSNWFELVVGGRVTRDTVYSRNSFSPSTCQVSGGIPFCLSPDVSYTFIPYSAVPIVDADSARATNFSYRVAPTFRISRDAIVFASYSTGYKGPGISRIGGQIYSYNPERVKNYEVGFKSELLGRRVRVNATAFYTKFTNFQTQQLTSGSIGFITANAGGLRSQGVETELVVRATRAITFNGGVTYADTKFTDYQYTPTISYNGLPPSNAPKWSYVLGATLDTPITSSLSLTGNVNYSYRSSVYQIVGSPSSIQEGYGLLSTRIGIGPEDGRWRVGVYGRNLTNQYFRTGYFDYSGFGLPYQLSVTSPEASRTVGGFLSLRI